MQEMNLVIILSSTAFLLVIVSILLEYLSIKYVVIPPEVVIDEELQKVDGIDYFVERLLRELSSEWLKECSIGKSKSEQEWAKKYWTFGKVTSVYLQYNKNDNSFSISVTAKKLGHYTGYQMIFGENLDINEIEFRVHSFKKHIFQNSFLVTYFSERNIPVNDIYVPF